MSSLYVQTPHITIFHSVFIQILIIHDLGSELKPIEDTTQGNHHNFKGAGCLNMLFVCKNNKHDEREGLLRN